MNETFTFRKSRWGMDPRAVLDTESARPLESSSEYIAYEGEVLGLPCLYVYSFEDNRLIRGRYKVLRDHAQEQSWLEDFQVLRDGLREKYGEPTKENRYWTEEEYQDNFDLWGHAVGLGHLTWYAQWELEESLITLALAGENGKIDLDLEYLHKSPEPEPAPVVPPRNLDDL